MPESYHQPSLFDDPSKVCTKCAEEKPFSAFPADSKNKSGVSNRCKECAAANTRLWYASNREHALAVKTKYWHQNKERIVKYKQQWKAKNPDLVALYAKKWREANKQYADELIRQWRMRNPGKCDAYREGYRARSVGAEGSYTAKEFTALCLRYGNKCLSCGRSDVRLTCDHVVPLSRGGSHDISNIQPLCGPCNSTKNVKIIDYRERAQMETDKESKGGDEWDSETIIGTD